MHTSQKGAFIALVLAKWSSLHLILVHHKWWHWTQPTISDDALLVFVEKQTSELWIFLTLFLQILDNFDQTPHICCHFLKNYSGDIFSFDIISWNAKSPCFLPLNGFWWGGLPSNFNSPFVSFLQLPPFEFTFSVKLHSSFAKSCTQESFSIIRAAETGRIPR